MFHSLVAGYLEVEAEGERETLKEDTRYKIRELIPK